MSADDDEKDPDSFDPPRWAADEPTAMWDDSSLKDAGYEQLSEHRASAPRAATGPATGRDVGGDQREGVQVARELTGGHAAQPGPTKGASGVSWALTIAIAVALGVAMYFLIGFLK